MSPNQDVPTAPADRFAECLSFLLAGETFAIDILCIKEIIEFRRLTVVPMMPEAVRGVINLRGAVVPVIDLQARFGRPSSECGKRTCIVIVEVDVAQDGRGAPELRDPHGAHEPRAVQRPHVVGLLVDAVNEVIELTAGSLAPSPAFGAQMRPEFIRGIAKVGPQFVIVLDVNRVLALDDLQYLPQDASLVAA